ncbi:citrate lyase subunit beta/citryl-CoA lyase [Cryobacterium mesophilum]|uniref:CoA ester lyase n=1 Tax=Terrimesophilobacter mesophilus TaxID=433647 RepID=A0A4R8V7D9_9MICO|nr:CoA ester lyase [Terrimesophilobacter mesophilus]MBB5632170.1 citrate lyase subunit beta/citryl-CoA lyase [Terrimesophilobacter mesophilus]TFB79034.1 CoA ester lyase [Terrimesophilobacter mesophilus]
MSFDFPSALLFCPADRPDRFDKAAARSPGVILDLEDAVAADDKPAAREALVAHQLDPATTIVRVNAADSDDFAADLAVLERTHYRTVMLPKARSPHQIGALDGYGVVALCETAEGVLAAPALAAHDSVVALMWGAEDLVASLGGTSSRDRDGRYRDVARHARSSVLLAAGSHRKAAIDAVHVAIDDLDGLAAEAQDAAASGFAASACIHPGQVAAILEAYRPSAEEFAWAQGVIAAASNENGVFRYEGMMVDEPVLRHAAGILRRSDAGK